MKKTIKKIIEKILKYRIALFSGLIIILITLLLSLFKAFESVELEILDEAIRIRNTIKKVELETNQFIILLVENKIIEDKKRNPFAEFIRDYCQFRICFDMAISNSSNEETSLLIALNSIPITDDYDIRPRVYLSFSEGDPEKKPKDQEKRLRELSRFQWKWKNSDKCKGKLEKLDVISASLPKFSRSKYVCGQGHGYTGENNRVLRKVPLIIECNGEFYPLLALQIACDQLRVKKDEIEVHPGKYIKLVTEKGDIIEIPIDKNGYMFINYVGKFDRFRNIKYSFTEFMGKKPTVKSKSILVGSEMETKEENSERVIVLDRSITPFDKYPGVAVQATVLDNILRGDFIRPVKAYYNAIVFLFIGSLTGVILSTTYKAPKRKGKIKISKILPRIEALRGLILTAIICVVSLIGSIAFFVGTKYWLDIATPISVLLIVVISPYFAILIYNVNKQITEIIKATDEKKLLLKSLRYSFAAILFITSFIAFWLSLAKGQLGILFAILIFLFALYVGGIISSDKFADLVGKHVIERLAPIPKS